VGGELKKYTVHVGGHETVMKLNESDAAAYGDAATPLDEPAGAAPAEEPEPSAPAAKTRPVPNKARSARNKGTS
jgi:hypothetical protein